LLTLKHVRSPSVAASVKINAASSVACASAATADSVAAGTVAVHIGATHIVCGLMM